MFSILDELAYSDFCVKHNLKLLTWLELKVWSKTPLDPPYSKTDLPYLDFLHWQYNVGNEWMVSEARARLEKGKSMTKTKSGSRTRSKRWRAGCKTSKPKYFWTKRQRTNFC